MLEKKLYEMRKVEEVIPFSDWQESQNQSFANYLKANAPLEVIATKLACLPFLKTSWMLAQARANASSSQESLRYDPIWRIWQAISAYSPVSFPAWYSIRSICLNRAFEDQRFLEAHKSAPFWDILRGAWFMATQGSLESEVLTLFIQQTDSIPQDFFDRYYDLYEEYESALYQLGFPLHKRLKRLPHLKHPFLAWVKDRLKNPILPDDVWETMLKTYGIVPTVSPQHPLRRNWETLMTRTPSSERVFVIPEQSTPKNWTEFLQETGRGDRKDPGSVKAYLEWRTRKKELLVKLFEQG